MSKPPALLSLVQKYFEHNPAQAAHSLETMPEDQAVQILNALPANLTAEAFPHLQVGYAAALLKEISPELFKGILEKLDPQQGAAIVLHLPEETRRTFIAQLSEKAQKQIQEHLTYPENSAGRMMNTHFMAFHHDIRVRDAIERIREIVRQKTPHSYVYVVDNENRLVGVINMRDLMLASGDDLLATVMRKEIFSADAFMDREQLAAELSKRRYFAVPVVDSEKKLLGIVRGEQLLGDVQAEATEDMQKLFGAGGDERSFSPILYSLKMRLPWLHINLVTAFLAGSVVAFFKDIIGTFPILAVYLPVIAGQGGNAGSQSLAIVIRGLVMREIPSAKIPRLIFKEIFIGTVNGIIIGAVTALAAYLWHGNPFLGFVVGLAMLVNLIVAGLTGAAIPLAMKGLGLDPAQCSNIILTTFTDVMGFLTLLSFAVLFKSHLV